MASTRLSRERDTIRAMFIISCRHQHGGKGGLCAQCGADLEYAFRRIDKCPYGEAKPICKNCLTHCYSKEMQARVRQIMRFAGPRMLWRHPWLTLMHYVDEWTLPPIPKK